MRDQLKAHIIPLRETLMRIVKKNPNKIWSTEELKREINTNCRYKITNRGAVTRLLSMCAPWLVVFKNPQPMKYIIFISKAGERWRK